MVYYAINCNIFLQNIVFCNKILGSSHIVTFYYKNDIVPQCTCFILPQRVAFPNNYSTTKCSILLQNVVVCN